MREPWRPKPGDRVVRHPREEQMSPVRMTIRARRGQSRALASPLFLIYVFLALITIGTALLALPFTHNAKTVVLEVQDPLREVSLAEAREVNSDVRAGDQLGGGFTPIIDALFTATSAATVTGIVTKDTATYWTRTGQAIILVLIFFGGLGMMTMGTFLLILIGQRVTLSQRILVRDNLQSEQLSGLVKLTLWIVLFAAGIQLVGVIALFVRFSFLYPPGEAVWQAAFQAVSAFNSAGFIALPETESLSALQTDTGVLAITGALIVLGAISYLVMVDTWRNHQRFSLYSLNSKLVLILTVALILAGALAFFFSEYDNPETIGSREPQANDKYALSVAEKATVSVFESISGRTAGFTTVDYGATRQHTNFFFIALMFIGGASASVAGGIKINTLAVVLVAVMSTIKGSIRSSAFGREINQAQVQRAISLTAVALATVFLMALMITFSESERDFAFIDLLFESMSALGTVGLSTGLTADLTQWGHVILIACMFLGRVGPLSLSLAMAERAEADLYRFAQERVTIG